MPAPLNIEHFLNEETLSGIQCISKELFQRKKVFIQFIQFIKFTKKLRKLYKGLMKCYYLELHSKLTLRTG
jgi:hypothetical protein